MTITLTREEAQSVLEALEWTRYRGGYDYNFIRESIETLRARLAQLEEERAHPELWGEKDTAYRPGGLAQPEPDPVAWHHPDCEGECIACLIEREVQNAYGNQGVDYLRRHVTAPPQRKEWQGLTDEEIDKALWENESDYLPDIIRIAEAKLKEKNSG